MPSRHRNRVVNFDVVDDHLEMKVAFPDAPDRSYVHRCTRDNFREVASTIEENAAGGMTLEDLVVAMDAPYTQVNVALSFMKERGCVEVRRRRSYPASGQLYEDAMIEFMFLAELPY
ncbi:MAG: hypothetical protein AAF711_00410 [Planctomycetota bacterium]